MKKTLAKWLFAIAPKKALVDKISQFLNDLIESKVKDEALSDLLARVLLSLRYFSLIFVDGNENNETQISTFTHWALKYWRAYGLSLALKSIKAKDSSVYKALESEMHECVVSARQYAGMIEVWND